MRRKIFFTWCFAFALLLLFSLTYVHPDAIRTDVPPSSQDDYPLLPEDQTNSYMVYPSFERLNQSSEVVFRGTIVEDLGSTELSFDEGFRYPISFEMERYRVRVDDVIRGVMETEVIVERNAMYSPSSPELKEGTSLIFFAYQNARDMYVPQGDFGYYYVAEDNRVYPTRVNDQTRSYSGMSLLAFKKEVRTYQYNTLLHAD